MFLHSTQFHLLFKIIFFRQISKFKSTIEDILCKLGRNVPQVIPFLSHNYRVCGSAVNSVALCHFSFVLRQFFFWSKCLRRRRRRRRQRRGGSSNCVQFLWGVVGRVKRAGAAFMNKRFSSVLRPHAFALPPPLRPLPPLLRHSTARRFASIYYAFGLAARK